MTKPNPLSLKRLDSVTDTRTFTDDLQPGLEISLTLSCSASAAHSSARMAKIAQLTSEFVTGDAEYVASNGENGVGPVPVRIDTGPPLLVNEQLCVHIGNLMYLSDQAKQAEKGYNFIEWVVLSERAPNAFTDMVLFVNELFARAFGTLKNTVRVSGDIGSPSPETNTPNRTRKS